MPTRNDLEALKMAYPDYELIWNRLQHDDCDWHDAKALGFLIAQLYADKQRLEKQVAVLLAYADSQHLEDCYGRPGSKPYYDPMCSACCAIKAAAEETK